MMPSSRWLQLSYVCGSYDKVFLLVLLNVETLCNGIRVRSREDDRDRLGRHRGSMGTSMMPRHLIAAGYQATDLQPAQWRKPKPWRQEVPRWHASVAELAGAWRTLVFTIGAPTHFEPCRDVSFGGVLCALQALAENGLFRHIHDRLVQLRGNYSTLHVIVLSAHMARCRIKAVEQLQYQTPGELGKLLGLDRVPEVRCLRYKRAALKPR